MFRVAAKLIRIFDPFRLVFGIVPRHQLGDRSQTDAYRIKYARPGRVLRFYAFVAFRGVRRRSAARPRSPANRAENGAEPRGRLQSDSMIRTRSERGKNKGSNRANDRGEPVGIKRMVANGCVSGRVSGRVSGPIKRRVLRIHRTNGRGPRRISFRLYFPKLGTRTREHGLTDGISRGMYR